MVAVITLKRPALFFTVLIGLICTLTAGEITINVAFPELQVRSDGKYHHVTMKGIRSAGNPGCPVLPVKTVNVLLPYGENVSSVEVNPGEKVTLQGYYTVMPGQKMVPLSTSLPPFEQPREDIYSSSEVYPSSNYETLPVQYKKGFAVLPVNIIPVTFVPSEEKLSYYTEVTLKVTTTPGRADNDYYRAVDSDRNDLLRMIDNPEQLGSYTRQKTTSPETRLAPGNYQYVIITNSALKSYTGPNSWQTLVDHKQSRNISAITVSTEWIYANYDGVRPDGTSDNQTKIRNFIRDAYANYGTEYVLLGGDADGEDLGNESEPPVVPCRGFFHEAYGLVSIDADYCIPSDLYYACLDGSFDYNANGVYGEENDGEFGGEVDLYAEVYVGRAPVDNTTELANFVRKTIAYENKNGACLENVYLLGEDLGWEVTAKEYMEEVHNGSSNWEYTTVGFANSPHSDAFTVTTLYDADAVWDKNDLISQIENGIHIINHLGHSNVNKNMKMEIIDVDNLTNTASFIHYSQGCYNGSFDNRLSDYEGKVYIDTDCIAEHMVTEAYGAVATISNSRYGWGNGTNTNGPSQYFNRQFWDAVLEEQIYNLGKANQDSKEDNIGFINYSYNRWCYYEINLLGDPETAVNMNVSSKGRIALNRSVYNVDARVSITVLDSDCDVGSIDQITVEITSRLTGDTKSVMLTETGAHTAVFTGDIGLTEGIPGDDALLVMHGDVVTATYIDRDDGTGTQKIVSDYAAVDAESPVIVSLNVIPGIYTALVELETNEVTDIVIALGPEPDNMNKTLYSSNTKTHSVSVKDLYCGTKYYGKVTVFDAAGNATVVEGEFSTEGSGNLVAVVKTIAEDNGMPDIHDGMVVWDGYRWTTPWIGNMEIMLYDGQEIRNISNNSELNDIMPRIYDGQVTWMANVGSNYEVFVYDGEKTLQVTNNDYDDELPEISNGRVIWSGNNDVWLYTIETQQLINAGMGGGNRMPSMYGSDIVWGRFVQTPTQAGYNVMLWNGTTLTDLENFSSDMYLYPDVCNGIVVWVQDNEIYYHNHNTGYTTHTTDSCFKGEPKIHNGKVVWKQYIDGDYEIMYYNGSQIVQLTDNSFNEWDYEIHNGEIVWTGGDGNVYFYNGTVNQITENGNCKKPKIHESQVVWNGGGHIKMLVQNTITADVVGGHGSIDPQGKVSYAEGKKATYTMTPDAGYEVKAVYVDGAFAGAVSSYTFTNISGCHTITVAFKTIQQ